MTGHEAVCACRARRRDEAVCAPPLGVAIGASTRVSAPHRWRRGLINTGVDRDNRGAVLRLQLRKIRRFVGGASRAGRIREPQRCAILARRMCDAEDRRESSPPLTAIAAGREPRSRRATARSKWSRSPSAHASNVVPLAGGVASKSQ